MVKREIMSDGGFPNGLANKKTAFHFFHLSIVIFKTTKQIDLIV